MMQAVIILTTLLEIQMVAQYTTNMKKELIKFQVSVELKQALQALANERNITLSALMRLMASEYVKRNQSP